MLLPLLQNNLLSQPGVAPERQTIVLKSIIKPQGTTKSKVGVAVLKSRIKINAV